MNKIKSVKRKYIKLRPHNVIAYPNYANPNTDYFTYFRKIKGKFHSDKLVKHWIKIIRSLHENPSLKFKYVKGVDSVCEKCEHKKDCNDSKHVNYKTVQDADAGAMKKMPELRFGKIYDGKFLKKYFKKKQNNEFKNIKQ